MKRLLLALIAGLAVLAATLPAGAQEPRALLRSAACQRAVDPASRGMSITAVMRPLAGTEQMAMRFEFLRRAGRGKRVVSLRGRGLKTWIKPTSPASLGQMPGDVWIEQHPVVDLPAPARYRFRVTFRWSGAGGRVIGSTVRRGPVCSQPELRPDLAVHTIGVQPLSSGLDRYTVQIRNRGRSAAGPFDVRLLLGAEPNQQVFDASVQQLGPHQRTTVRFRAAACAPGDPIAVSADPGPPYEVDDAGRANNTLAATCPSA